MDGHWNQAASQSRQDQDSVQDAHRLLSAYPMASTTSTTHVARHLNHLTLTASPPSYIQPEYYASFAGNQAQYAPEIQYLSGTQSTDDSGYWETNRDDAVRYIGEQAGHNYPYPATSQQWTQQSAYCPAPLGQSVLNRMSPNMAYPTPPPQVIPMASQSSSLAFALGRPEPPPSTHHVAQPAQSAAFFDDFLATKKREIAAKSSAVTPVHRQQPQERKPPPDSPDPLSMTINQTLPFGSNGKAKTIGPGTVTPRKRKPVVELASPSLKRVHSHQHLTSTQHNAIHRSIPKTPSSTHSSSTTVPSSPPQSVPATPATEFSSTPTSIPPSSTHSQKSPLSKRSTLTLSHIELKPKDSIWVTPSKSRPSNAMLVDSSPGDLGGYGPVNPMSPARPVFDVNGNPIIIAPVKTTGRRDDRGPLEKLTTLLEDIFEADDTIPSDGSIDDLNMDWWSPLSVEPSRPILSPSVVKKLTKYIQNVGRPPKRIRVAAAAAGMFTSPISGKKKPRLSEIDEQVLTRALRLLIRGVKEGEALDPFASSAVPIISSEKLDGSPKKPTKKSTKGKNKSNSPAVDGDLEMNDTNEDCADPKLSRELTELDFDKLEKELQIGCDAILSAECCISLLAGDRLAKHFYSEELITQCLTTVQNQLKQVIYPFIEASSPSHTPNSPLLQHVLHSNKLKGILSELFRSLSATIPRITTLLTVQGMSESVLIKAVYIAIDPFFVVESAEADGDTKPARKGKETKDVDSVITKTFGKSAMRGLRMDALELIRNIFASYDDQRSWIIEEILSSLIKLSDSKQKAGHFRLRDGRSIRTVSALLLQLVQTCAHDVRLEVRKVQKARNIAFAAMKRQETLGSMSDLNHAEQPNFLDEHDVQEIDVYTSGLESATKAAKTIVLFLNSRSGKGKATKNSNEAEYRTIFDNLISDLLVVLYWPEWPAASLLLSIASKFMLSALDDIGTSTQTDNNAAKTIALDHIGVIAARIKTGMLKTQKDAKPVKPLDDIVANLDIKELEKLLGAHSEIAAHLSKRSSEDQAYDSAQELTAATLGQELAAGLKRVDTWIDDPNDEDLKVKDRTKLHEFGQRLKTALKELWKDKVADIFDIGSQEETVRVDRLSDDIGAIQSLRHSFHPILIKVLQALQAPPIFVRTKGIRALNQILTSDPNLLTMAKVHQAIESHLRDSSPAVRDAAVELVGKFMVDSPEMAGDYYQKTADRIADTGLSVRKRVIKLLKAYYTVISDTARQVDITTRLVLRMHDEDDTVKDLALKTIQELWFPPHSVLSKSKTAAIDKGPLLAKVSVIMGVAAAFNDRQSPLEEVLHKIIIDKENNEAVSLRRHYTEICEALIDGLVDASDLPDFTVGNCVRTIYFFTSAYPPVLTGTNASTLLPYLKAATNPEEQALFDYLLKIFRITIPHMPKTTAKFAQDLQTALLPMIIKPTSASAVNSLQESIACLCCVVQHITHDFGRLIALLKSINKRLQMFLQRPVDNPPSPVEVKPILVIVFLVSLLVEHCKFDQLRSENESWKADLDTVSPGPITEHMYRLLLQLHKYDVPALRGRILQCLGFLFRAQPTLMTLEPSTELMDSIFERPDDDSRARLLKIMQDFLMSEADKHSAREKELAGKKQVKADVNMEELVGNTDGFADSGVASAIVQRYIDRILDSALSQQQHIQSPAIDILSFTIKQGLAHPLQSFPIIVALETSPNSALRNRAAALHGILHNKHTTLINTRYLISAKASYAYQTKICTDPVRGFVADPTPVALLQRWYFLIREKRPVRQEFLRSLSQVYHQEKVFTQDDVDFARYMTENFSAFEYKTQEEVLTVIRYLTSLLSTAGMELLQHISPEHLLNHLNDNGPTPANSDATAMAVDPPTTKPEDLAKQMPMMRNSVIIGMAMLLKAHLKQLYGLSEDKCQKFVLGKKSAIGDKPASRRNTNAISWARLPFVTKPLLTMQDIATQKEQFLAVWNEDGVTAEPEDDLAG